MNNVIFIIFVALSIVNVLLMAMLIVLIVATARRTMRVAKQEEALKEGVAAVEANRIEEVETLKKFLAGDFSDLNMPFMNVKNVPAGYDKPTDIWPSAKL